MKALKRTADDVIKRAEMRLRKFRDAFALRLDRLRNPSKYFGPKFRPEVELSREIVNFSAYMKYDLVIFDIRITLAMERCIVLAVQRLKKRSNDVLCSCVRTKLMEAFLDQLKPFVLRRIQKSAAMVDILTKSLQQLSSCGYFFSIIDKLDEFWAKFAFANHDGIAVPITSEEYETFAAQDTGFLNGMEKMFNVKSMVSINGFGESQKPVKIIAGLKREAEHLTQRLLHRLDSVRVSILQRFQKYLDSLYYQQLDHTGKINAGFIRHVSLLLLRILERLAKWVRELHKLFASDRALLIITLLKSIPSQMSGSILQECGKELDTAFQVGTSKMSQWLPTTIQYFATVLFTALPLSTAENVQAYFIYMSETFK